MDLVSKAVAVLSGDIDYERNGRVRGGDTLAAAALPVISRYSRLQAARLERIQDSLVQVINGYQSKTAYQCSSNVRQ